MRRYFLFLIMPLVGFAAWHGGPVTRASLRITAENAAPTVCKAPVMPDLREAAPSSGPEAGCDDPGGCENKEHISATFLHYAIASLNAYGGTGRQSSDLLKFDPSWKVVGEPVADQYGLGYIVFVRTVNNEDHVLVAFRGTDPIGGDGWWKVLPTPADALANASWVTQWFNPWDQYRLAREAFMEIRKQAIARAQGRVVRFHVTGHSLGGGLAVHIARGFPCTAAVVFNTSCVTNRIRFAEPYIENQVVDIRESRDLLTNTLCAPAVLLGWSRNHQLYGAEWIRIRRRENVDEMDVALRQHAIGGMAFAMGRTVLCCAQNQRRSSHESCACAPRVVAEVEGAKRILCDMRRRPPLRRTTGAEETVITATRKEAKTERRRPRYDSCDFSPIQQVERQCRRSC
jgi:pimeloyl-ACP methyl ester carboxylesterase